MPQDATPTVVARVTELLREAAPDQGGALFALAEADRQLDANVVRLAPGAGVARHVEPDLDVLLFVVDGEGRLTADTGGQTLAPGTVAWLPRGSGRALAAGPAGLVYLTVHRRRPGMAIRPSPPS
ncbi:cupin domain-containing protein [Streptomyces specialis]|uniref:cupin domain-containing protein n=1 Tax=Streptomyces specialis TaxID=498367 RepID=UPI00073EF01C|nr:cupin domain-containing protein [Streptomyces specialis]